MVTVLPWVLRDGMNAMYSCLPEDARPSTTTEALGQAPVGVKGRTMRCVADPVSCVVRCARTRWVRRPVSSADPCGRFVRQPDKR